MSTPALSVPTAILPRDAPPRVATGTPGPVAPEERIALLDVLRGFALFGILLVNFLPADLPTDGMTWRVLDYLIEGSFYAQFSLLFGIGFAVQLLRSGATGRPFALRYLWRTALLFGIGAAHYVLLWGGDIVHAYALLAVVLLAVHRFPRPVVFGLALLVLASETWPEALAVFLLGLWVGRGRVLEAPREHRRLLWVTLGLTFVVGVLGAAVHSFGEPLIARGVLTERAQPLVWRMYTPGNVALGLWYGTAITLLVTYRERWARWLSAFGWAGRAGLTNYLLQSAVMTTLLHHYGLGLEETLTFWPRLGVMLALFVAQTLASRWWLRRFRFGPVEWLWRTLTWGAAPAMRAAHVRAAVHGT